MSSPWHLLSMAIAIITCWNANIATVAYRSQPAQVQVHTLSATICILKTLCNKALPSVQVPPHLGQLAPE